MSQTDFERFKEEKESQIGQCLRGRLGEEDGPDMPSIDSADSLKEQYYWFMLGINNPPEKDNIDWEGLEKELRAYADEVAKEWYERKRDEDRAEAFRSGRL
ncbi:hypothetical protein QUA00_31125 [Microcoleus sp. T2B6]|uniref:hypothetical protein n=2 Tax=unclassified Microcoleus TaxID=2642155 RepID=UPI002FD21B68